MPNRIDTLKQYWQLRLLDLQKVLERNNFEVFVVDTPQDARDVVMQQILPDLGAQQVLRGDSLTCLTTQVFPAIDADPNLELIDPFAWDLPWDEKKERMRNTLAVDVMITGSNAVTEQGQLVNLDMVGNRVGGLTFGPKHVVVMVGRNKVVGTLDEALRRVKEYAAPANAIRLEKSTPCVTTGRCMDCNNPGRICNIWTIIEKSYPKGKIKVILINDDLGL